MSDAPSSDPGPDKPQPPAAPPPAPPSPDRAEGFLTQEFRSHVDDLIQGKAVPTAGTEDFVEDLKVCARKQAEARQALQQASQLLQAKQGEAMGLDGEATALLRVLKRAMDQAAQKT